tara:strand:- start:28 stop:318 length:291 start_codon:yes stop_codon:yes gene_type:complete
MPNSRWFMLFTFVVVTVWMQSGQRHIVAVKSYELFRKFSSCMSVYDGTYTHESSSIFVHPSINPKKNGRPSAARPLILGWLNYEQLNEVIAPCRLS